MTDDRALARYRLMVLMRRSEEACLEGVASKEIHGEVHTAIGQEAVGAALAEHVRDGDAVASTHRNHLHAIAAGVPLVPMLAEIFEKSTGLSGGFGGHMHLFDPAHRFSTTGIVGAGLPVALGHAYAAQLAHRDAVAFAAAGDGAVNTGAFHETMNLAGVLKAPLVVLVENNEWAISVPFSASSATATIAERAAGYAAWGVRVDGLDVGAVSDALGTAVARARGGEGPSIVEAMCYRFRGHYEGDLDLYRDQADKRSRVSTRDPIVLLRARLEADGTPTDVLHELEASAAQEIAEAMTEVRAAADPDPADAARHVFASGLRLNEGMLR